MGRCSSSGGLLFPPEPPCAAWSLRFPDGLPGPWSFRSPEGFPALEPWSELDGNFCQPPWSSCPRAEGPCVTPLSVCVGEPLIPFIHMSVYLFRTLHPMRRNL